MALFLKSVQWGNFQKTTDWNAKMLPPQLSSLAVRITVRSVIHRITASDDRCIRGGLHGYEATGHAQEKPKAVYNHWTGLVDWTGGLTLKIIFYTF